MSANRGLAFIQQEQASLGQSRFDTNLYLLPAVSSISCYDSLAHVLPKLARTDSSLNVTA